MSFEADWAGLKQEAAERAGARTHLAGAGDGDGWAGATGDDQPGGLKTHRAGWTAAGESVGTLRKGLRKALTAMEEGQESVGPGSRTGGIESGAAQREVYASWKRYLEDVGGRCGTLRGRMIKAGQLHHGNDEDVRGAFADLADAYRDAPGVGGPEGKW